jgi:hypothetical protein
MTVTAVDNEEPNLDREDALEYLDRKGMQGRVRFADRRVGRRERIGQAWFNCLTVEEQDKLRGGLYDPFHKDEWPAVIRALRFLLDN